MRRFDEASLEQVVIERLAENGFTYVYGDDIERETTDVLIREDLVAYLKSRYPELTEAERAPGFRRRRFSSRRSRGQGRFVASCRL